MGLIRTFLFVPGSNPDRIRKALTLNADAVIVDLEDAVAPDSKAAAREGLAAISVPPDRPRVYVRVNAAGTPWHDDDLRDVPSVDLAGIMLPKAETAEGVAEIAARLAVAERAKDLPEGGLELIPLVETARGVRNAEAIAGASARVKRLAFGAIDYTLDIGATFEATGATLTYPRSKIVVDSRVAGVGAPIDTVYPFLDDSEGYEADCRLGHTLGFGGKLVIHPKQIEPANRAYAPSQREIDEALEIIAAFEEATAQGASSLQLRGQFIDKPVADRARQIVALSKSVGC